MAEHNPLVDEWIAKAEGDWEWTDVDITQIRSRMRDGYVYHLQQCIEKLMKARLLQLGQTFRKTHDLVGLSFALHAVDPAWSWDEDELEDLTESGVMNRYPGFDTSIEELEELKEIASRLRQALLLRLGSVSPEVST
ncbi:HEPN domain-containing protein [Cyanobium sp. WAJ14-Wanaka]|uniref:HEPN domain-containing protein n=1 Tax=Cyanobium sp. WAJ14-Wanaka TaxID=2823725 RepID=UPI0020CF500C|nr:HEPN domain-containing protein [Cyanobium sp. WAJ14-Wanaka]MCP9774371.1 HEPN domain-containing protein [Cyanobium sp. WAJ14-Wanaka]